MKEETGRGERAERPERPERPERAERPERPGKSYIYIVKCADGTLYTGWTTDVERRVATHNLGKGAKYTRSRLPVELVYFEEYETKEEAMSREVAVKRLPRAQKLRLIENIEKSHRP